MAFIEPQEGQPAQQFETAKSNQQIQATGNDSIEAKLNDLFKQLDKSTWPNRQARFFRGFENELFWRGVQLFTYDADVGTPIVWDENDQDLYNPVNLTRWSVEMNSAEYTNSQTALVSHSDIGEDRKVLQALPDVDYLSDCLYFDMWISNPELEQREAHRVQFRGGVVGLVDFDRTAGPKVKVPRYKQNTQTLPGSMACPDCGVYEEMEAQPDQQQPSPSAGEPVPRETSPMSIGAPQLAAAPSSNPDAAMGGLPGPATMPGQAPQGPTACPHCGAANISVSPPKPIQTLAVEGYDEVPQGAVTYEDFDLLQVGVDSRAKDIKGSSWVRLDQVSERTWIKERFPWVTIEDYTPMPATFGQFSGLHFLRQLEVAANNSGELDQSEGWQLGRGVQITDELTCLYSRVYLDKHKYAEWVVPPEGLELPGSKDVLPGNSKFPDAFPAGLLCHLVNDKIVQMENVDKNTRLTAYKFGAGSSGFHAPGCDDIISINKAYNETNSVGLAWMTSAAYGITLADEKIKGITNSPDWVGIVEDRRPEERLSDMFFHQENPGPTGQVEMVKTSQKGDIQLVGGARNPNVNGMPGEGMRTATGVSYQSATSDSFAAMRLLLRAWQRAHAMGQAVALWRENALRPQWFTKYGETRGRFLDPMSIPGAISFRVEKDSHQPVTNDDMRANTLAALQAGWSTGKLSPTADEFVGSTFRMPKTSDSYALWETKIERRLDAMKQIDQMLEQAGLGEQPEALQLITAPMIPKSIDDPIMFERFIRELYLSDEYENYTPLMQMAIEQLYEVYKALAEQKMMQQMLMASGGAMAAAPSSGGKSNPQPSKGA